MTCRFQCDYCQDVLSVADKLVGKRIRCPLCETVLAVPEVDPNRVFLDVEFSTQLGRFKLTDWDQACARKALELGLAEPPQLRKAIVAVRRAAKKGKPPALNEQLLADGAIERSADLALCELVKGAVEKKEAQELTECPNCFAAIPAKRKCCNFCGQRLGDLLLYDMCPNCKKEQPAGHDWCRHCGASMATGLLPGAKRPHCPRCGQIIKTETAICPKCRTALDTSKARIELEDKVRVVRNWWAKYSLAVVGAVVVLLGLYAYKHWVDIKGWLVGQERAELDQRLADFDAALRFNDLSSLKTMLDPTGKHKATQAARTIMLGGKDPSWVVKQVGRIHHARVSFDKAKTRATVYANIEGQFDPSTVKYEEVKDVTDISKAAKKLRRGHILNAEVPWKWVQKNGEWFYAGPFPRE